MSFGEKLKSARKQNQLTQKELADLIGVKNTVISNWENDLNKPDIDTVEMLCYTLKVSTSYFFTAEQPAPAFDIYSLNNVIPMPKMKRIPLLGTIACGTPTLAEENIEDYIYMDEHINGTFALKCKGDSMINARIFDGDMVFIREQPDVNDGEIAAVRIGNDATLKKVYKYPNKLVLRACNPTFDDIVYNKEELNDIAIIGKAVAFVSIVR